jgi:perosamine synthetase
MVTNFEIWTGRMTDQPAGTSIPWFLPEVGQREKELVLEVLESNYINDGNVTRLFESRIAEIIGVRHCVAVTSGTTAITLALMGLGIGSGDEVIVPDLTFIATANAVRLAGADVKLVDIEPKRFVLDNEKTFAAIGPRTRAIVPVDVNGRSADYVFLEKIVREKGLSLISDSAEALGSQVNGRYLGTFGDAGCFSFSANKTITTGQGGMIATNNTELYNRLLELKDQGRRTQGSGGNDLHPVMGYNFKLTNLQAAVGLAQLEKITVRLEKARERDAWYQELLKDCQNIYLPSFENKTGEVTQWTDILTEQGSFLEKSLKELGIGYRNFWYPLHRQVPYACGDSDFSHALSVSRKGLWLPSSFSLTQKDVERTAEVVRCVMENRN